MSEPITPNQTLRQYARAIRDEFFMDAANSMHITKAAYDRVYPVDSRKSLWFEELRRFASHGEALSVATCESVCRDLNEQALKGIRHDFPSAVPEGYFPPSVRKFNREHERAMIEARKRGREAALTPRILEPEPDDSRGPV